MLSCVYASVRDRDWGTVPLQILHAEVFDGGECFRVTFQGRHEKGEVAFEWRGDICGARDSSLSFSFDGVAGSDFWRNRIGFCVLHPMSYAGTLATLEHTDGRREETTFPVLVAPHCPFRDLRALTHEVAPGLRVRIELHGDEFETEDQRNWTDASFKTYCTPLERPFPVRIRAGERVQQQVFLRFEDDFNALTSAQVRAPVKPNPPPEGKMPPLGLTLPAQAQPLSEREAEFLRALSLSHLRVDVELASDFTLQLGCALQAARALDCALESLSFLASGNKKPRLKRCSRRSNRRDYRPWRCLVGTPAK